MEEILIILNSVKDTMFSVINIKMIVIIVSAVLGGSIGLYVCWFAIRTLINSIKNALHGNLIIDSNSRKARKWYAEEGYKYYSSYDDYKEEYNMRHGAEDGYIN